MERKVIRTSDAPDIGLPLSQAIGLGNLIFTSGVTARDPRTREFIGGTIERQTERVILNLKAILEAAGSSLEKVVKVTVFLTDIRDFEGMNKIDARVEIEMIALV
jgi:2-iminobutanoate/2-iminopropanoate deaminase